MLLERCIQFPVSSFALISRHIFSASSDRSRSTRGGTGVEYKLSNVVAAFRGGLCGQFPIPLGALHKNRRCRESKRRVDERNACQRVFSLGCNCGQQGCPRQHACSRGPKPAQASSSTTTTTHPILLHQHTFVPPDRVSSFCALSHCIPGLARHASRVQSAATHRAACRAAAEPSNDCAADLHPLCQTHGRPQKAVPIPQPSSVAELLALPTPTLSARWHLMPVARCAIPLHHYDTLAPTLCEVTRASCDAQ